MVSSRGVRGTLAAVAVAVLALGIAACSGSDKKPSASGSGSQASQSPAPASAIDLPSTTPTTDATPPLGPCDATTPGQQVRVSTATADVSGDNANDTITVYGSGTDASPAPWHLRVALGGSKGAVDVTIPDASNDPSTPVKVLGASEISAVAGQPSDGSGAEVFVEVDTGASTAVVGVFQLTGCNLTRLAAPGDASPSAFAIGGSVTHLSGLRCEATQDGRLLAVLDAQSTDGVTYQTSEQLLQVEQGTFSPFEAATTSTLNAGDPVLQSFSILNCPGVTSP